MQELLLSTIQSIQEGLLSPFLAFDDPSKRLFVGFILSALALSLFSWCYLYKRSALSAFKALANKNYWFNPSSQTDMAWLLGNSLLKALLLSPLLITHLGASIAVSKFLQANLGDAPELALSSFSIIALFSLVFFIAEDLSRFLLHLLMHKIPWLWQLHKVHHSATTLTPFTLYRQHSGEMLLYTLRGIFVYGLLAGSFVWLFSGKVSGWAILGVDALGFLFNFLGSNLRHSHIWLPFGFLEKVFISPAQHQIHHSKDKAHYDSNFGTCLALWDQLNHSLIYSKSIHFNKNKTAQCEFGL